MNGHQHLSQRAGVLRCLCLEARSWAILWLVLGLVLCCLCLEARSWAILWLVLGLVLGLVLCCLCLEAHQGLLCLGGHSWATVWQAGLQVLVRPSQEGRLA